VIAAAVRNQIRRYRVKALLSKDPADNFAAVRIGPSIRAEPAEIDGVAVHLAPGYVVTVDSIQNGWLHIAQPAPWGWVAATLFELVTDDLPIGPPSAPALPDLTFAAPPRITPTLFTRVLVNALSPAAADGPKLYGIPIRYGLDPGVALAIFDHESSCGTRVVQSRRRTGATSDAIRATRPASMTASPITTVGPIALRIGAC
jgi:hypothetical protein